MELSSGKKIIQNTFFLYFRMIIIMLISLYTVRLVLRILGVEDYGLYNVVGGVVASMSFLTNVLSNASQRFYAIELAKGENEGINNVFSSILIVYLVISLLIIVIVEVGGLWLIVNKLTIPSYRIDIVYSVFHFSLATFIINVLSTPYRALIIAFEKMNVYAYISLFDVFGKLAIVYLLYNTTLDKLYAYTLYLLLISLISNSFYIFYVYKKAKIRTRLSVDRKVIKAVMGYSSWTLFGSIAGTANMQGNSILLNIFVGPVANAAFAISNQVSSAVQQLSSNFYTAVAPPLTKSYSSGNMDYMNTLFWFSSKAIFFLSFILLFPFFIQTEYVLTLWLGEVSEHMVSFVRIMLLYSLIISIGNPISTIVQAAGNVKQYHTIVDGFGLLVLPVSYIFLMVFKNPDLALLGMVFVFSGAHILRLIVLSKTIVFSIKQYIKIFITPGALVVALCSAIIYLTGMDVYSGTRYLPLLYMFLSFIISCFISFFLLFNKEERKRLLSYIPIPKKNYYFFV